MPPSRRAPQSKLHLGGHLNLDRDPDSNPTPNPDANRDPETPSRQAVAAAHASITEGTSRNFTKVDIPHLESIISRKMYDPIYVPLVQDVYSYMR